MLLARSYTTDSARWKQAQVAGQALLCFVLPVDGKFNGRRMREMKYDVVVDNLKLRQLQRFVVICFSNDAFPYGIA
jgi:hypothetical protein